MTLLMAKGVAKDLVGTSASFTACAASGVYTPHSTTAPIRLGGCRKITLFVAYNAAASASSAALSLVPEVSAHKSIEPIGGVDDIWFVPAIWDGAVTTGTLTASSLPSGTDFTTSPNFARIVHRAADIRLEPSSAATDKIRVAITLNVENALWLRLLYAEAGDTAHPGNVWISYVVHA